MHERIRNVLHPVLWLLSAALAGAIARFAVAGFSARMWADDYCYSSVAVSAGFFRAPVEWFLTSGNRFSTILMVSMLDVFGLWGLRLLPALILVAFLAALFFFLRALLRAQGNPADALMLMPFVLAGGFFLFLLAPDRLQSLYWRMGALHYTFPLSLLLLQFGLALRWAPSPRPKPLQTLGLFLLAFFAGGFSETFAALQTGALLLAFLCSISGKSNFWKVSLPGLLGSLAAMLLMLLSPSNLWRQAALPPPENLWVFASTLVQYSFQFVWDLLRGYPAPLFVFLLLTMVGSALLFDASSVSSRRAALIALAALLAGVFLAACAIAPSVYAGLQFPAGRALLPALFGVLAGLCAAAGAAAIPIRRWVTAHSRPLGGIPFGELLLFALLLGGLFYTVRQVSQPLPEQAQLTAWAQRWDARDAQLRALAAQQPGSAARVAQVEVVRGIEDLDPDPAHWINRCAAAWYGLESITAEP